MLNIGGAVRNSSKTAKIAGNIEMVWEKSWMGNRDTTGRKQNLQNKRRKLRGRP